MWLRAQNLFNKIIFDTYVENFEKLKNMKISPSYFLFSVRFLGAELEVTHKLQTGH